MGQQYGNRSIGRRKNVYGLYDIYEIKDNLIRLEKADKEAVLYGNLGTRGKAYKEALVNLHSIVKEAFEYYNMESYKDDNFRKAKEIHQPLMYAFKKYFERDKELRDEIKKQQANLKNAMNKALKKQHDNHAYTLVHNILQTTEAIADDLVSEKSNHKTLTIHTQKLNELIKDIKAFEEEKPDKWMYSFTFVSGFENFYKSARQIIRNSSDKNKNSETETQSSIEIIDFESNSIEEIKNLAISIPSEKEQAIFKYNRAISTANKGIELYFPIKFRILYFEKINIQSQ